MIFIAHQHGYRPLRALGFLEGNRDAVGIGVALDEVIVDTEGVEKTLGIGRGGVGVDAVAGIAAVADHHHHRNFQAQAPAAHRITGFHHAGVLDQDHGHLAAGV